MASKLDAMSPLERATHARWRANAAHVHFGRCDSCDQVEDENGKPLLVARQPRRRKFECLRCWEGL